MNTVDVAIIDYGVGNLHSVLNACKQFTDKVVITEDPQIIRSARSIILPGVGSFEAGMQGLAVRDLTQTVIDFARSGKPVLGICLGAQLLLSKGYEFGEWDGLDLIKGTVVPFPAGKTPRVPHIGWNALHSATGEGAPLLAGIKEGADVYFVHSYILVPEDKADVVATSRYGDVEFAAVLRKGAVWGCQFHPEKSSDVGIRIIKNFITLTTL